jgi:formylglycine-generating enzyme required for sulfatase activity
MAASTTQLMDFTLGFAKADQAWVDWIVWVLESAGYTIDARENSIPGKPPWEIKSPLLVIVLSEELYVDSEFQRELNESLLREMNDFNGQFLCVQVEDCEPERIFPGIHYIDIVKSDPQTAQELVLRLARSLPLPFNPPPQPPFRKPQPSFPGQPQGLTQTRRRGQVAGYIEKLGDSVQLEMMQIPGGMFTMGALETEEGSSKDERPTRRVTVPPFYMGCYPVTQAQWRFVTGLPQISRKLYPDRARFKGDTRPIERVSWLESTEFCARLSRYTGRKYRLPTEAEWEYACRSKTTTPFHVGKIIDSEVANYRGSSVYGEGCKGVYREETTPVGFFTIANAFGLYDMHGNVWEWCMDHWYGNYQGAPSDGSAWIDVKAEENDPRVLRGGSWDDFPAYCRSASRSGDPATSRHDTFGFRLVSAARMLP